MLTSAKSICPIVYAREATPAACPRKLHPSHDQHGLQIFEVHPSLTSNDPRPYGYMLLWDNMFGDKVHATSRGICRYQLGNCISQHMPIGHIENRLLPEEAMMKAAMEPTNQAHTAVAGPPTVIGTPYVAGWEPRTPRIEIAYEYVDHLVNSRRSSCFLLANDDTYGFMNSLTCLYPFCASSRSSSLCIVAMPVDTRPSSTSISGAGPFFSECEIPLASVVLMVSVNRVRDRSERRKDAGWSICSYPRRHRYLKGRSHVRGRVRARVHTHVKSP